MAANKKSVAKKQPPTELATARLRYVRISVRKARTVLNMVRGKNVAIAIDELRFTRKAAAPMVAKLLESAIANARQQNENIDLDKLIVTTCFADKAPDWHMRRFRPRAQGRATRVQKGMSHITVAIGEK